MKAHGGKRPKAKFVQANKEKIREAYLAQEEFSWAAFCRSMNWDSRKSVNAFPVAAWQREWLEKRVAEADEGMLVKALAARNQVLERRIEAVQDHTDIFKSLRYLFKHALKAKMQEVQNPQAKPIPHGTLLAFSLAEKNLISCEIELSKIRKDLRDPVADAQSKLVGQAQDDVDQNPVDIEIMGVGRISERDATSLALEWLDQKPAPKPEEPPA